MWSFCFWNSAHNNFVFPVHAAEQIYTMLIERYAKKTSELLLNYQKLLVRSSCSLTTWWIINNFQLPPTLFNQIFFIWVSLICFVCRTQASELAQLIARMQQNADQVEKNILRTEKQLVVVRRPQIPSVLQWVVVSCLCPENLCWLNL